MHRSEVTSAALVVLLVAPWSALARVILASNEFLFVE